MKTFIIEQTFVFEVQSDSAENAARLVQTHHTTQLDSDQIETAGSDYFELAELNDLHRLRYLDIH